jgi:hypothetical protein
MKYIENSNNCFVKEDGTVIGTQGRPLKPSLNRGYPVVVICYKDGTKKSKAVHRIVAETLLPPPTEEQLRECEDRGYKCMTVNHIDGNKENNHVSNLEWSTYRENNKHAVDSGLNTFRNGELSNFATITEDTVHAICKMLSDGSRNVDVVKEIGVSRSIVDQVRSGLNWKHISSQYDFPSTSRRRKLSDSSARWVCECLEKNMKPSEILELSRNDLITRGVIKTIKRRNAYHHITKDFNF